MTLAGVPGRELILIAGVNGAGKTTLVNLLRHSAPSVELWLNPDEIARLIRANSEFVNERDSIISAMEHVQRFVDTCIEMGRSVAFETVLSTSKYTDALKRASANGFRTTVHYVALSSVELAIQRVAQRVSAGGHDVPEEAQRRRWDRSLDNAVVFSGLADRFVAYANNDFNGVPVIVAMRQSGRLQILNEAQAPELVERLRRG